jgi:hypothetical protein
MSEWKWTETKYKARAIEYRVVKGTPLDVELGVNQLINEGYVLNGQIMEYVIPSTNNKIFVQAMVKYDVPNTK